MMTECLLWERGKTSAGYGAKYRAGKQILAHRAAWEDANKTSIPKGMFVLHRCDNRLCINSSHLFIGTQLDNIRDMISKGRAVRKGCKGHSNGKSIFTEHQVKTMRQLFRNGVRICDIHRQFGGAYQSVWLIVKAKNWSHLNTTTNTN
jgi:hypothetical protein